MSNPLIKKKKKKKNIHGGEDDDHEIQQLLRAAQDDVLLKLTLNSHTTATTSSSAAAVDPDLDRRYQALKMPKPPQNQNSKLSTEDDLFARFDALKKSIPIPSNYENNKNEIKSSNFAVNVTAVAEDEEEEDSEDEVEKVIKWAVDAARLDPSPLSDDDYESSDDGVVTVGKNK